MSTVRIPKVASEMLQEQLTHELPALPLGTYLHLSHPCALARTWNSHALRRARGVVTQEGARIAHGQRGSIPTCGEEQKRSIRRFHPPQARMLQPSRHAAESAWYGGGRPTRESGHVQTLALLRLGLLPMSVNDPPI